MDQKNEKLRQELDAEKRKTRGETETEERECSNSDKSAEPLSTAERWLVQGQGCRVGVHLLGERNRTLSAEQQSEKARLASSLADMFEYRNHTPCVEEPLEVTGLKRSKRSKRRKRSEFT